MGDSDRKSGLQSDPAGQTAALGAAPVGLGAWLDLLVGFFQFPGEIRRLILLLRKTPEEKHEELLGKVEDEFAKFEDTGRPTW